MRIQIKYHSKYESEAEELQSFLEDGTWDEFHQVISERDDGLSSLDVEIIESEEDVYDVICGETTVCSKPSSADEVVDAIFEKATEWGVKPYEYDEDGNPIDKPE